VDEEEDAVVPVVDVVVEEEATTWDLLPQVSGHIFVSILLLYGCF